MESLVSVVLLSWNRKDDLKESLSKLKRQSWENLEVIVVDNGSTDGTSEVVKKEFPEVKFIPLPKNIGIEGYNVGMKEARGKYIVLLDDDSNPSKTAISQGIDVFAQKPNLGIIAGNILNLNGQSECEPWIEEHAKFRGSSNSKPFSWFAFIGCGAIIKKEVLEKVGYYPKEYFLYWNENELSARVIQAGYTIEFHPEIIFYHRVSLKQRPSGRKIFYSTRNKYWFILKYFPFWISLDLLLGTMYQQLKWTLKNHAPLLSYFLANIAALSGLPRIFVSRSPLNQKALSEFEIYLKTVCFSQLLKNKIKKLLVKTI